MQEKADAENSHYVHGYSDKGVHLIMVRCTLPLQAARSVCADVGTRVREFVFCLVLLGLVIFAVFFFFSSFAPRNSGCYIAAKIKKRLLDPPRTTKQNETKTKT